MRAGGWEWRRLGKMRASIANLPICALDRRPNRWAFDRALAARRRLHRPVHIEFRMILRLTTTDVSRNRAATVRERTSQARLTGKRHLLRLRHHAEIRFRGFPPIRVLGLRLV